MGDDGQILRRGERDGVFQVKRQLTIPDVLPLPRPQTPRCVVDLAEGDYRVFRTMVGSWGVWSLIGDEVHVVVAYRRTKSQAHAVARALRAALRVAPDAQSPSCTGRQ